VSFPFLMLLGAYLIAGTTIAILVHRARQTQEQYFIGGRRIGGVVSALTYAATTYSAFMMVGLVGLSFQTGIGALVFELAYLAGTVFLLSVYGKKIWRMSRETKAISPMELFTKRYGRLSAVLGTAVAIAALIPYTSSQVIGLALVFQNFGGFNFTAGVSFAAVIVALWALLGGLRGVALTDSFQGVFMIIVALAGFFWAQGRFPGIELQQFPSTFWTLPRFVNFTLPWFFFALTNPQVLQRLFIPRDTRSLNRMILYFALFGLLYTLIVTFIGFASRAGAQAGLFPAVQDRDSVIFELLAMMGNWLAVPLALSIIFAAVSTANSIILTLSSMVVRDLFRTRGKVWMGRGFIILLTLVVFLFSLMRPNYIVELGVASSSVLLCFLPLLFGLFHWKLGGPYAAVFALASGAGSALILRSAGVLLSSVYTLIAAFAAFFAGALVDSRVRKRG
jgi:SSS family solute:Na+ symporter